MHAAGDGRNPAISRAETPPRATRRLSIVMAWILDSHKHKRTEVSRTDDDTRGVMLAADGGCHGAAAVSLREQRRAGQLRVRVRVRVR